MEKTETSQPLIICDAGPLIHLDELGVLDLLADFQSIIVPEAVCSELERHRPSVFSHPEVTLLRMNPIQSVPSKLAALTRIFTLHTGEWEALRLALEFPTGIFITDDTAARLAAGNLGIKTHGTIGILVRAIRRKQRTRAEILNILHALPRKSTLHLKPSLLQSVINELKATQD